MHKLMLPPDKIAELKQRQRELHDILPEIDKLEQCGQDCSAEHEVLQEAQRRITNILKFYGPDSK